MPFYGRNMPHNIWDFDDLLRFAASEDAEVRFWAVDRLIRHHPVRCCDAVSELLLDDHDATPAMVARHLGQHGDSSHHAVLVRGFRLLRGLTPGYCLHALVRLGYSGVVDLAADALKRGDLEEPAGGADRPARCPSGGRGIRDPGSRGEVPSGAALARYAQGGGGLQDPDGQPPHRRRRVVLSHRPLRPHRAA
jgi:hypothetical protein